MPIGRPSSYTEAFALRICEELADGKSLRAICEADDMPDRASVRRWLESNEEFRRQYARARAEQAENLAEEIIQIADDGLNDTYTNDDGVQVTNHDVIARSKLRVDARKWYASKLAPKVFGDKLAVGGAEDLPAIKTDADPEDVARRIAFILASSMAAKESEPADPGNSTSNSI